MVVVVLVLDVDFDVARGMVAVFVLVCRSEGASGLSTPTLTLLEGPTQ